MHIRIALAHVHPCNKFGVPRSKGVRARGQKAENNKIASWGQNFDPSGLILPMTRNSDQGASDLKVWAPGHFPFGLQPWQHFSKGSRGGTWHVAPRDRRHRRSVAPAHRMSRLPSGSAQLFRRYSRNPHLRWPLPCRNTTESSAHFCHQMSATPLSRGEYKLLELLTSSTSKSLKTLG